MPDLIPSVLLIEDDESLRGCLAEALREEGWTVAVAGDGAQALERLHAVPLPTAIVLDLMMPVMDGHAFIDELRKDEARSGLPVIQISSGVNTAIPGVAARLDKPFRIDCLLQLLDTFARVESAPAEDADVVRLCVEDAALKMALAHR